MNLKSFWPALERLGLAGAAHDWNLLLGGQWKSAPLHRTPRVATSVLDPRMPARRLDVADESDENGARFAIMDDDMRVVREGVSREEVTAWEVDQQELADQLAHALRFAACDVRPHGDLLQVGNVIERGRPAHPVFLFVPPGGIFDAQRLLTSAASLPPCTLLLTRGRWITAELAALAAKGHIMLDPVAERLEAAPDAVGSVVSRSRRVVARAGKPALLDVRTGWTWSKLRVLVDPVGKIHFRYGRESGTYTLRHSNRTKPNFALVALGKMAVRGKWTPPPLDSPQRESAMRAMHRLQELMEALVPISGGGPFESRDGDVYPAFQVRLKDERA